MLAPTTLPRNPAHPFRPAAIDACQCLPLPLPLLVLLLLLAIVCPLESDIPLKTKREPTKNGMEKIPK